jgi:hypothetical protein
LLEHRIKRKKKKDWSEANSRCPRVAGGTEGLVVVVEVVGWENQPIRAHKNKAHILAMKYEHWWDPSSRQRTSRQCS